MLRQHRRMIAWAGHVDGNAGCRLWPCIVQCPITVLVREARGYVEDGGNGNA